MRTPTPDELQRFLDAYLYEEAAFLVDRKGIIVDVMIGYEPSRLAAFEKHIDKLLAK